MGQYTLYATDHGRTAEQDFDAQNDTEATMRSIALVMHKVFFGPQKALWYKGRIVLESEDGEVITTMPARRG